MDSEEIHDNITKCYKLHGYWYRGQSRHWRDGRIPKYQQLLLMLTTNTIVSMRYLI